MKKIQKNPYSTFASLILEKENLVEKLNNKQIEILKKTEKSKIKTTQEKAMLTRTLNNVHKILNKLY
jgi:hypothetical protein